MSTCDTPAGDYFLTLTGFDEIAVAKSFGEDISGLVPDKNGEGGKPFQFLRALVFVHQRRQGLKDREAYNAAQELPFSEVQDYFADDAPDVDPDDPDTEAGKEPSPAG